MSILAIIAALLLEQWRPLVERKSYSEALTAWSGWVERTFNAGEARHGTVAWVVAALLPVAAVLVAYLLLFAISPLLALVFNVAALYFTLGFRQFSRDFSAIRTAVKAGELDRAREVLGSWRGEPAQHRSREEVIRLAIEEALAASHRHVFGVVFWFVVLPGPSGAVLYRMAQVLRTRWAGLGPFGRFAERAQYVLDWPAVRLTAIAFAVVGDFEDAVLCWRTQAHVWIDPGIGVVLAAGAGALGIRLGMPLSQADGLELRPELGVGEAADAPALDASVGLVWRALVVWIVALVVLSALRLVA